uniref:VTC domain-containing protein n=1 Tax=Pyramimonas obovata TaxID=1411642 RepID=A0A7S0QT37_9CHLO|mmetsp:Transcript_13525/g.28786  ORF Transcript_13525/g.28786 Transcript_13525/m.28786 type:complete len:882 (+) Transcript_13525:983-3628(+)
MTFSPPPLVSIVLTILLSAHRSTKKYWVKQGDLLPLSFLLVKHLPVLMFGQEGSLKQLKSKCQETIGRPSTFSNHATWITSVYMDSESHDMYAKRIQREEGAQLLRLRWYGLSPDKTVFVERKTHHEDWVGEGSVKERFELKTDKTAEYFRSPGGERVVERELRKKAAKGEMSDKETEKAIELATEVRQMWDQRKLQSSIRSVYQRTAFQRSDSNKVRITLDTRLHLSDETDVAEQGQLWRNMDDKFNPAGIAAFPYSILEIKLQDEAPPYIQSLLEGGMLQEVTKFSKFLTGCAILHKDKLKVLPHWMDDEAIIQSEAEEMKEWSSMDIADTLRSLRLRKPSPRPTSRGSEIIQEEPSETGRHWCQQVPTSVGVRHFCAETHSGGNVAQLRQTSDGEGGEKSMGGVVCVKMEEEMDVHSLTATPRGSPKRQAYAMRRVWAATDENQKKSNSIELGGRAFWQILGLAATIKPPPKVAARTVAKIEPKTFFANERTFIQWLSAAVLLVSLAVLLLGAGGDTARTCGFIVLPVAAAFCVYALFFFEFRRRKIRRKDPSGYDDPVGPFFLTASLIVALVAVAMVTINDLNNANSNTEPAAPLQSFTIKSSAATLLPMEGYTVLEFQPSGVAVVPSPQGATELMIPSNFATWTVSTEGGVLRSAPFPSHDLEDITTITYNGRSLTFLLSENQWGDTSGQSAKIYMFYSDEPERQYRFHLDKFNELSFVEGLTFVPDDRFALGGVFFVGDETGFVVGFQLTPPASFYNNNTTTATTPEDEDDDRGEVGAVRLLNREFMNRSLQDPKIGAMNYLDGLLYVMYDNSKVLQAWDLTTGTLKAKFEFPWMNKQLEGFAFDPSDTRRDFRKAYFVSDTPAALYTIDLPVVS